MSMMQEMNSRYCDVTEYPEIFEHCYWGNFSLKDNQPADEVITNRNKFIEKLDITAYANKKPDYLFKHLSFDKDAMLYEIGSEIDHYEIYRTKNKSYVLISSPYSDRHEKKYIENGWQIYDKLYTPSASTYIKIVQMKYAK